MKAYITYSALILLLTTVISCNKNKEAYLKDVLSKIEKIESATYYIDGEAWQPGDTTASFVRRTFVKEYNNPMDSTIGASYVSLNGDDTTKLEFVYDGSIRTLVYHDAKKIVVDDFTTRPLPFRPLTPPFFNYTKNIIKYTLETQDSISVEQKDLGDSYYFKLVINEDKQVEFFGNAHYIDNSSNFGDPTSIYELWISKSNNLPYKVRREMSHDISVTTCSDLKTNNLSINNFNAFAYFPDDYEVRKYGEKRVAKADLTGKAAPDWTLNDMNEQAVSLKDFKSKVLLINLTGIGCGACQASIPFLKRLSDNFSPEDFELVAIESWIRKPHSLRNYSNKNGLNYKMLSATDEVVKDFQTGGAAPYFFILDNQRVIRKVFFGYGSDTTEKEIMKAINELL